jgi:voltage-gated potassium channel
VIVPLGLVVRRVWTKPPSSVRVASLLVALVAYGTSGFLFFEVEGRPDLTVLDALWWTSATLTTVGYGDIFPMTTEGRFLVAVPMMVLGIGLFGYVLSIAAVHLVETRSKETMGMASLSLRDHLLVVNFPNLAKIERLLDEVRGSSVLGAGTEVVIIDEDLAQLPVELASRDGVHFVRGNPARDETLSRASIDGATRAFVLSKRPGDPHSDDLAIAIALAIEARKPSIHSVVECVDVASEEVLRKAGSNSVVCGSRFDAHFLGAEMAMPGAQDVVDQLLSTRVGPALEFVPAGASTTFGDAAGATRARGQIALGLRRRGEVRLNPPDGEPIVGGDELIVMGASPAKARG